MIRVQMNSKGAKVGDRFGKLIIQELLPNGAGFTAVCGCDCGSQIRRPLSEIGAYRQSCGCTQARHGHTKGGVRTREHRVWTDMRQRCENPNNTSFKRYGGRGIKVCERWQNFANFLEDMAPAPAGMEIDRIDNNLGYFKENCRWVDEIGQSRNRRNVRLHTVDGVALYAPEWAVKLGVRYRTLASYLQYYSMQEISDLAAKGQRPTGCFLRSKRK